MGDPQLETVRRAYRAFARRDVDALRAISHAEIEVHAVTGMIAGGGEPYRGPDGLADYIADVERVWDDIKLTPQTFERLDENQLLVSGRVRVRRESSRIDTPNAWLWEFEGDLVRRVRVLNDPDQISELLGESPGN